MNLVGAIAGALFGCCVALLINQHIFIKMLQVRVKLAHEHVELADELAESYRNVATIYIETMQTMVKHLPPELADRVSVEHKRWITVQAEIAKLKAPAAREVN